MVVKVTTTPRLKLAVQPVPAGTPAVILQLIPAGLELTTPVPVPLPFTVSVFWTTAAARAGSVDSIGCGCSWQPCRNASVAKVRRKRAPVRIREEIMVSRVWSRRPWIHANFLP